MLSRGGGRAHHPQRMTPGARSGVSVGRHRMSVPLAVLILLVVNAVAVAAMLLVRRGSPEGSRFQDGDRASGVFGMLGGGFAIFAGFIIFLAFTTYDDSRSGAETEALAVIQQFETAQYFPPAAKRQLGGELVCYGRYVERQNGRRWRRGTPGIRSTPGRCPCSRRSRDRSPRAPSSRTRSRNGSIRPPTAR